MHEKDTLRTLCLVACRAPFIRAVPSNADGPALRLPPCAAPIRVLSVPPRRRRVGAYARPRIPVPTLEDRKPIPVGPTLAKAAIGRSRRRQLRMPSPVIRPRLAVPSALSPPPSASPALKCSLRRLTGPPPPKAPPSQPMIMEARQALREALLTAPVAALSLRLARPVIKARALRPPQLEVGPVVLAD